MFVFKKYNDKKQQAGFSLLELLVVIAIMGVVTALFTGMEGLKSKKSYVVNGTDLANELANIRYEAATRGTTTRLNLDLTDEVYTLSTLYASAPTAICNSTGSWTQIKSYQFNVADAFEITGSGVGDVCFDRDGTSTGAVYNITQKDGGTDIGSATITVIMATGYIDVVEN